MKTYQKGYTLTEIMIAVGVVAALVIGGLGFYNHAIMKAQANQAMTAGKLLVDDVIDFYARFASLPTANLSGNYIPKGNTYIKDVIWVPGTNFVSFNNNAMWGFVHVTFKSTGLQQGLIDRDVKFYLIESNYRSFLQYHGCLTNIDDGMLNSTSIPTQHTATYGGQHHPILPECKAGDGPAASASDLTLNSFPSVL
jgi:prepilin-type N-terminal cleavage/methylation domain-containing protein